MDFKCQHNVQQNRRWRSAGDFAQASVAFYNSHSAPGGGAFTTRMHHNFTGLPQVECGQNRKHSHQIVCPQQSHVYRKISTDLRRMLAAQRV